MEPGMSLLLDRYTRCWTGIPISYSGVNQLFLNFSISVFLIVNNNEVWFAYSCIEITHLSDPVLRILIFLFLRCPKFHLHCYTGMLNSRVPTALLKFMQF
jgi:hypothetical protein